MNTKKITLARTALRWGLAMMLLGFGLFITLIVLKVSTVHEPVVFWKIIMQIGFITGLLGALMIFLVSLTFLPGAFRFAKQHTQQHLQTHGKSYITVIYAIGAGLSAMTLALIKAYGAIASSTTTDDNYEGIWSGNKDSVWSEDEANAAGTGSHQWRDRYL